MFDFKRIIRLSAQTAGDKPIVAAPYSLPKSICRDLGSEGLISGYIADEPPAQPGSDPFVAGWWNDHKLGNWFIRNFLSRTLILLTFEPDRELSGQMLLEARLKGICRILIPAHDGSIARDMDVIIELMNRLQAAPIARPAYNQNFADLFRDIYDALGDYFRIPSSVFASDRVLLVTGSLQPGGSERQLSYTASALARQSYGKIFIARSVAGANLDFFKSKVEEAGVVTCMVPDQSDEFRAPEILDIRNQLAARHEAIGVNNIFHTIFHHALLIRDLRPGLVHTWLDYCNVLAGIAADLVGVPRLVLSGRSVAPDNFEIFQPYMGPGYHALLSRREPLFLNNSEAGAADYARWLGLPRERLRVIHNGFEFPEVMPDAKAALRREFGIAEDAIVVGSIIRFGEEKRPELMVETARVIHESHPQVRFVFFGDGPLMQNCRSMVEASSLADVIKLPGLISDAWTALSTMDIFLLTSRLEGLPNVLVEAQCAGVPVVCTGGGGMTETFVEGATGFAVSSPTATALATTIIRLVDDNALRDRMGKAASRHARETFGIDRMVDLTLHAYRDATEHKPGTTGAEGADFVHEIRLCGITQEEEHGFSAGLPPAVHSPGWDLWEDGHRLGPARSTVADIRAHGAGRYSVAQGGIFFSSSDGSDARFNGRTYRLRSNLSISVDTESNLVIHTMWHDAGHGYRALIGPLGDAAQFELWEDDMPLGPRASLHDDIRAHGEGRYSIWDEVIYFSSSDNSDPKINGRKYVLRKTGLGISPARLRKAYVGVPLGTLMRHVVMGALPRQDFVPGRVVQVCGSLGPGGAERQLCYVLAALAKMPLESVQLLCNNLAPNHSDRYDFYLPAVQAAQVPARVIRKQSSEDDPASLPAALGEIVEGLPEGLARDIADLYWEFTELKPELVHAWLDWNNVRAGLAAVLAGVPRIVLSGRNVNPTYFGFYQPYMDPAYKALIQLPQVTMINNSRAGRDDYAKWLGVEPQRILVVHNGIDLGDSARDLPANAEKMRQQLSLKSGDFLVGGVFRLAAEKRPLLWVEAAAEVARRLPNARFVMFGEGEMRKEVENKVRELGLQDRLVLPGITNNVLAAILTMDVFMLTSYVEGIPNVVLEAQWVGTPVVATRSGGTEEVISDGLTGWIVGSSNPGDIADRIIWLHDNPDQRAAVRVSGPAWVKQSFSVDRMIADTVKSYRLTGGTLQSNVA